MDGDLSPDMGAVGHGGAVTLAGVVTAVGPELLDVMSGSDGLERRVQDVAILDLADPESMAPRVIALAVGIDGDAPGAIAVVERAAAREVAAIAFRFTAAPPTELTRAAQAGGVALLGVQGGIRWGQLHALIRTALAGAGEEAGEVTPGDLFALANGIAAAVGGAVTIEDRRLTVLAHSTLDHPIDEPRRRTILGRAVPEDLRSRLEEEGMLAAVRSGGQVVRMEGTPAKGMRPRLAIGLRAGPEYLGSIWVIEGATELGDDAARVLREAAPVVALELLRHRGAEDSVRRRRAVALRALLEGRCPVDAAGRRLAAGLHFPVATVAFAMVDGDAVPGADERLSAIVALSCEPVDRRCLHGEFADLVIALLHGTRAEVERAAQEAVARGTRVLGLPVLAGIGGAARSASDVPRSRREAELVLEILRRRGREPAVASIDGVRAQAVVLEAVEGLRAGDAATQGPVAALAAHDARAGTPYADTLRAVLAAFGDRSAASRSLNIHPNTLRYRLARISELVHLDLADPDARLAADLELRLLGETFAGLVGSRLGLGQSSSHPPPDAPVELRASLP